MTPTWIHSQLHYLFILPVQICHCAISSVGGMAKEVRVWHYLLAHLTINWIRIEVKVCNSVCWPLSRPKLVLVGHLFRYNVCAPQKHTTALVSKSYSSGKKQMTKKANGITWDSLKSLHCFPWNEALVSTNKNQDLNYHFSYQLIQILWKL